MLFRIDLASDLPLYAQVATAVRAEVTAGRLSVGDPLPSAREVAGALGVNLHTVLHAYQTLRDEGLVDLRRGRGAVVTESARHFAELNDDIARLVERGRALGLSPDTLAALVKEAAR